mmetsp:Transcript_25509/g.72681  ORF Transcript_25509/g.72681 Transcript_25509/m.72681 type:complete len:200 (+) Transcript_25509:223-822(+)
MSKESPASSTPCILAMGPLPARKSQTNTRLSMPPDTMTEGHVGSEQTETIFPLWPTILAMTLVCSPTVCDNSMPPSRNSHVLMTRSAPAANNLDWSSVKAIAFSSPVPGNFETSAGGLALDKSQMPMAPVMSTRASNNLRTLGHHRRFMIALSWGIAKASRLYVGMSGRIKALTCGLAMFKVDICVLPSASKTLKAPSK